MTDEAPCCVFCQSQRGRGRIGLACVFGLGSLTLAGRRKALATWRQSLRTPLTWGGGFLLHTKAWVIFALLLPRIQCIYIVKQYEYPSFVEIEKKWEKL